MNPALLKIAVILGSTRPQRLSEKVGHWIFGEAKMREGVEVEVFDLRDYNLPFYNEPKSPTEMTPEQYSSDVAKKWAERVAWADAYIIIAPEYNHGYPAVLKNALDYVYFAWNKKAVGFVSYGGVAGARSVEQLRQVAIELQMAPIRNSIHIPNIWGLLDSQGNLKTDSLQGKIAPFFDQLMWWGRALKAARES